MNTVMKKTNACNKRNCHATMMPLWILIHVIVFMKEDLIHYIRVDTNRILLLCYAFQYGFIIMNNNCLE